MLKVDKICFGNIAKKTPSWAGSLVGGVSLEVYFSSLDNQILNHSLWSSSNNWWLINLKMVQNLNSNSFKLRIHLFLREIRVDLNPSDMHNANFASRDCFFQPVSICKSYLSRLDHSGVVILVTTYILRKRLYDFE